MKLRRSSESLRATVSQEFRQILFEESDVAQLPPGAYRHVQILVPQSPEVVFIVTPDARFEGKDIARAAGANRVYKGTVFPANGQITLCFGPDQGLWAAADSGYAVVGLLVEYCQD